MFVCLTGMEKMLLNWRKNSKLGRRGAFFHCVHSAFLLTVSSHMAGKSPNAILALAIGSCSLITKENLSHHWQMLRFRSWNWKPKGLNQKTEMPKKKKKEEPYQNKSLHCTHCTCISPRGEEKRARTPHDRCQAFCFRHFWKLLRFYAEECGTRHHRELHHKNPSRYSTRKMHLQGRRP